MSFKSLNAKTILLIVAVILVFLIGSAVVLSLFTISAPSSSYFNKKVAVIPIKGEIVMERSSFSPEFGALAIVEKLEEADADPSVGVIFLDIDSPGGSVVATKQIVYKIRELNKPSVAYIGEAGASGAYYVAAATDYVIADSGSIVGSIGVISIIPNIEKLLENWGVEVEVLTEGKFKGSGSIFESLSEEEKALFLNIMEEVFVEFKEDILEFRQGKLQREKFEEIADGRILSGKQALEAKLVDELLPREQAIEKAARLAGIEGKPSVTTYYKEEPSIFDLFFVGGKAFAEGFKESISDAGSASIKT